MGDTKIIRINESDVKLIKELTESLDLNFSDRLHLILHQFVTKCNNSRSAFIAYHILTITKHYKSLRIKALCV